MHLSFFAYTNIKNLTLCDKLPVWNFKLGVNSVLKSRVQDFSNDNLASVKSFLG